MHFERSQKNYIYSQALSQLYNSLVFAKLFFMCFSARKLLSIRLFDDDSGKRWQKSVKDMNLEMLCVSQFTLYNRLKGNKPDFHLAMSGPDAQNLYNTLLQQLQKQYVPDKIKGKIFV